MNRFWTWMDDPEDDIAGVGGGGATIAFYVMAILAALALSIAL